MAFQAHNFSLDDSYKLTGAVTHTAATGVETAATVAYIDIGEHATSYNGIDGAWSGSPPVPGTPTQGVYARFAVVVDIGAIDTTITGTYRSALKVRIRRTSLLARRSSLRTDGTVRSDGYGVRYASEQPPSVLRHNVSYGSRRRAAARPCAPSGTSACA